MAGLPRGLQDLSTAGRQDHEILHNLSIILLISLFFLTAMLIWWVSTNVAYTLGNVLEYGFIFSTLAISIIWLFIIVIPCNRRTMDIDRNPLDKPCDPMGKPCNPLDIYEPSENSLMI